MSVLPWWEIAEDLETLALLHDREPDGDLLAELRRYPLADWLGLRIAGSRGLAALGEALAALPHPVDRDCLDILAADFADIYLVGGLQASPSESPWIDRDQLVCQEPMFEVRDWYRHYGLASENWRQRADDHLVLELRFLARLASLGTPASLADMAAFLDLHLLRWLPDFAERVSRRCATAYFAGVALLTADYVDELRDVLTQAGFPVRQPETLPTASEVELDTGVAYLPGAGPGW